MAAYRHIDATFGTTPLDRITPQTIQRFVNELGKRKVSRSGKGKIAHPMDPTTIRYTANLLASILGITEMNESNDSELESTVESGASVADHGVLTPNLTPPGPTLKERLKWLCERFAGDDWFPGLDGICTPPGQYILPGDNNDECTGPLLTWIRERFGMQIVSLSDEEGWWIGNRIPLESPHFLPTQIEAVVALIVELYLAEAGADRMDGK